MNNHQEFFEKQVPQLLKKLKSNTKGKWGTMNVDQMLDHLQVGTLLMLHTKSGVLEVEEEKLPRYKAFLMSDKGFTEGAPKPKMYAEHEKINVEAFEISKEKLVAIVLEFDKTTASNKDFYSFHPTFGVLNAEESRQLQFKHIRHHFQQFELL